MKTIILSGLALFIGCAVMAQGSVKKAVSSPAAVPAGYVPDSGYPNSGYKVRYVDGKACLFPNGNICVRNDERPLMVPKIRNAVFTIRNMKTN